MKKILITFGLALFAIAAPASANWTDWIGNVGIFVDPVSGGGGVAVSGLGQGATVVVGKDGNVDLNTNLSTRKIRQPQRQYRRRDCMKIGNGPCIQIGIGRP